MFSGSVDGILRDSDIAALAISKDRKRVARESFKTRSDAKRKEKEEKIMSMPFDQLTKDLKSGVASYKDIEVDRLEREKNNLKNEVNQFEANHKKEKPKTKVEEAKKRIEELDKVSTKLIEQNTPDNVHFPWKFLSSARTDFKKPEGNLKGVFPYLPLMTQQILDHYFKAFIQNVIDKDWEFIEDVAEPLLVKNLKKEMSLLPSRYKLQAPNIKTCKTIYDLYDVKNVFMSSVNTNRKKSDSIHNYHINQETLSGVPVYMLNKKRAGENDDCGYVMQFSFNVYTDLRLQVLDEKGQVVLEDPEIENKAYSSKEIVELVPHSLQLEIMACKGKLKSLRRASYQSTIGEDTISDSITNFMSKRNFRIIDFDGFMNGNQLLVGLEWSRIAQIIQQEENDKTMA